MLKSTIPFVDLRGKNAAELLRFYPDKARDIIRAARRMYGKWSEMPSYLALPLADTLSHRWLKKQKNPYLHEIETSADLLSTSGVYSLNTCLEWGCTSGAFRNEGSVSLMRVLDWPFPDLGKHVVVTLQQGRGGSYYNVTWPGLSGVFTAMAPDRFSASINQAPMRKHRFGFAGDWVRNRASINRSRALPAAHLLRQVFDNARTYQEAKELLIHTPISLPAIFVLAGVEFGQGCVIERLENSVEVFELSSELRVTAANHFNGRFSNMGNGWWPREADSPGRYRQSCTISASDIDQPDFRWLQSPIVNTFTRLCVVADAATQRLMVQGFEGSVAVTELFSLPGILAEQRQVM